MKVQLRRFALAVILLSGCAQLPSTGDGVVALEVTVPTTLSLTFGDSLQLSAVARDRSGEEVVAAVRWATSDSTISVDSLSGLVVALDSAGTGQVQASSGTLRSNILTFQLSPATTQ